MIIETGAAEDHPGTGAHTLPLDQAASPGVAPFGYIQPGQLSGPTIPGRDVQGEYAATQAAALAECSAAQDRGMSAEQDRRGRYGAAILPQGGDYGEQLDIPVVPDNAVPPAMSDLYPYPGLEPTPAGVPYGGDEPRPQ
jgi:hypothetical protein